MGLHRNNLSIKPSLFEWPGKRAIQTFKQGTKKQGRGNIETKLTRFLLSYRITPQTTTDESPAQLRWGRSLKSHLDML